MICPFCKFKGFKPTPEFPKPLIQHRAKESYDTVNYRRYVCLVCGRAFKTAETFECEVQTRKSPQQENLEL